jgi:hypothetical protein
MYDSQCVWLVAKVNFLVAFAKIATVYFSAAVVSKLAKNCANYDLIKPRTDWWLTTGIACSREM